MDTTTIGHQAEAAAARYLESHGYRVVERNWRTRWCEIDVIAIRGSAVSLVEVKYRSRNHWGSGMDYITPLKRKQMAFAAEFWMAAHEWLGPVYLAAVEVTGPNYEITGFLPEL